MSTATANGTSNRVAEMVDDSPQRTTALIAHGDSWWDDHAKFELIQRASRMFASSPLVPEIYRGPNGLGSVVIALNMAQRMGADPLMVMQNLYVVHGRPSWSAQFMIACFNKTGRFSPVRYRMSGAEGQDDWGCTAWSTDRETGEKIEGPLITIAMAKAEGWYGKNGSKWKTIPRLMLMYRAASWLVRTHAPELTMGLHTVDEQEDIGDERRVINGPRITNIGELSEQINAMADDRRPVSTANESEGDAEPEPLESADSLTPVKFDLSFQDGEATSHWCTRVVKVIQTATCEDDLLEIQSEIDRLINDGSVTAARCKPLIDAINTQQTTFAS